MLLHTYAYIKFMFKAMVCLIAEYIYPISGNNRNSSIKIVHYMSIHPNHIGRKIPVV